MLTQAKVMESLLKGLQAPTSPLVSKIQGLKRPRRKPVGRPKKYTPEVLRAIRAALDRGVTTQQIADALGIKQAKYVYTLMLRLKKAPSPTNAPDKPKRKYTPKLSPKEVKTILGLIQEGHSTESIAEAAKVSTRTVQRIGRKYLHEPVSPIK